jgi:hypothetical protein
MSEPVGKTLLFLLKETDPGTTPFGVIDRFQPGGRYALNRTEWRGKEPRSCAVTNWHGAMRYFGDKQQMAWDLEVSYRPKGFISYVANTRYDGWTAMLLNRETDPPAYVPREVYGDIEFNDIDFGEFVSETDVEQVKHTTAESLKGELMGSGRFSAGLRSSFMAPHRSRPHKKLILTNSPTGVGIDGFGTHILNINNSTPNLQLVIMDQIVGLMCEFLEGKAALNTMGNDSVVNVRLIDALVDCTPNERNEPSRFNILDSYIPPDFMVDLAKRLMSIYAVEISVVDDEKCSLVIRREENSN